MKVTLILCISCLTLLTTCHVGRFFVYNFANINDYKKFQNTEIKKGAEIFNFETTDNKLLLAKELNSELVDTKTVAFVVIQDDTIKYQWYDEKYDESSIVTSFSMSKSYVSALIGIALAEGSIKNLEEPITNYIDLFKNEGFEKITIQHLLDMRTGIDYNESYYNPFGNVAAGYYGRNLDRHIANLKIKSDPGQEFEYISIATQLLGNIVESATGKSVSQYMEEKIWSQIGMEHSASWSLDKKSGREKAFCCINARTLDFAKFARLYLNEGIYNSKQIIPKSWIKQSVEFTKDSEDEFYQNQWWLFGNSDSKQSEKVDFCAQGHLGQYMYMNPIKKTIILRFGKQYGGQSWTKLFRKINRNL